MAVTVIFRHGKLFDTLHFPIVNVARRILPFVGEIFGCGLCLGFYVTAGCWLLSWSVLAFTLAVLGGAALTGCVGLGRTHHVGEAVASLIVGAVLLPALVAFGVTIWRDGAEGFWQFGAFCCRGAVGCLLADLIVRKLSI